MTTDHTCSYYCDRPECIRAQRDELREKVLGRPLNGLSQEQGATCKGSLQVDLEEGPKVTQRVADMPMSEYRRGVNDGFKLGQREGRIKAEDEMMVGPIEPTRRMIEAGAQRLVSWEDGSVWPDSWDALQVAAARNDAERVWRSMRAEAPKQGPRREWRGLTDQEIGMLYVIWDATPGASMAHFARAIEAALKEKNHE
jgi:hypothetical protein